MEKLHAMVCKMCGSPLNDNLICPCCGVAYKFDDNHNLLTIETFNRKIVYLNGTFYTPAYLVDNDPEKALEYTLHEIASCMAVKLLPLIEFRNGFNPREMCYQTDVRIGVADPYTSNPFEYSEFVKPFDNERFKFIK